MEYDQRLAIHIFGYFNETASAGISGSLFSRRTGTIPPCNVFVGEALELLYAVTDFKTKKGFLSANEISDFLADAPENWVCIGSASDQQVLRRAQERANRCHPTIAVYRNLKPGRHGHVSVILPGELRRSWTWGMMVPNSASSFLNRIWESYSGNKLSYAFSSEEIDRVRIYYRRTPPWQPKRSLIDFSTLFP